MPSAYNSQNTVQPTVKEMRDEQGKKMCKPLLDPGAMKQSRGSAFRLARRRGFRICPGLSANDGLGFFSGSPTHRASTPAKLLTYSCHQMAFFFSFFSHTQPQNLCDTMSLSNLGLSRPPPNAALFL